MRQIENRSDVETLVGLFYGKIRQDSLLGAIFDHHITEYEWPHHLSKLADFWETNLFGIRKFKGNPTQKHIAVDKNLEYSVSLAHFSRWVELWTETIDENFEGELAWQAKNAAHRMASGQFIAIWNHRPK